MSEDKPLYETAEGRRTGDGSVKQEFKLYIKASQIDKETRGSCPICQQWFMIAYLIAQEQEGVNFSVFTVQENNPPKEFYGWSKKFPVVVPVNCTDKSGRAMGNDLCDNFDDLERFFENINRLCPELKRHNKENAAAMKCVETLYATFNGVLTGQPKDKIFKALHNLDAELDNGFTYLIDDSMCFVDTFLMPRLHHIKVALQRYNVGEIPSDCKAVWRYLANAYQHPAFLATMPSDQDIIHHYKKKATAFPAVKNSTIEKFSYNTYVPEEILADMKQNGEASSGSDMNQQVEQPQQMEEEQQQWVEEQQQQQMEDNNGLDGH